MSGGVYGNMLSYFSELMENYDVYKQIPNVGAGWTRDTAPAFTVRGIMQNTEGASLNVRDAYSRSSVSTGSSSGIVSVVNGSSFWSEQDIPLVDCFTRVDGVAYRFMTNGSFVKEGGFYAYTIAKVVGNNGETDKQVSIIGGSLA